MIYVFKCPNGDVREISAPIDKGPPRVLYCTTCGEKMKRVYFSPPVKYNTQGFHATDYDSQGDKLERFNKNWEKKYGEKAPEPARDIKRNASDIQ